MADVTQQEAEELADALINAAGALVMNASQMNQSRCADARHRVVEALTRPAPSPSDVDDLSTLSREHLIWRVTNWRRCFEQQQERAHRAEAELSRLRGAAVPEGKSWPIWVLHHPEIGLIGLDLKPVEKKYQDNASALGAAWSPAVVTLAAAPEVPR